MTAANLVHLDAGQAADAAQFIWWWSNSIGNSSFISWGGSYAASWQRGCGCDTRRRWPAPSPSARPSSRSSTSISTTASSPTSCARQRRGCVQLLEDAAELTSTPSRALPAGRAQRASSRRARRGRRRRRHPARRCIGCDGARAATSTALWRRVVLRRRRERLVEQLDAARGARRDAGVARPVSGLLLSTTTMEPLRYQLRPARPQHASGTTSCATPLALGCEPNGRTADGVYRASSRR